MRGLGNHDRPALGRGGAGDPLAQTHARPVRRVVESRSMCRTQLEHVRRFVVDVDEACVGVERVGHLGRDQLEYLRQVERRVDRGDGVGQQLEVPCGAIGGGHG